MYGNVEQVQGFTITNAAKDLRQLVNTMSGEGKTFIYGVSYGTQLALRAAQLDGLNIDGLILDSLVPMQNDSRYGLSKRSHVVDSVGKELLDKCNHSGKCGGETSESIKESLSKLIVKSNNLKDFSENLPDASLSNTLGVLLDIPPIRNEIPKIIRSLSIGNTSILEKAINDVTAYYSGLNLGSANFGSSIPLVQIITASENNLRPNLTKSDIKKEDAGLLFTSPISSLMAENSMPTYEKDNYYAKLPTNLPKTLILQGTLDPKTHFKAAKTHAFELSKLGQVSFVDVTDGVHFIALTAPECFKQHVGLFMTNKEQKQTACQDEATLVRF